MEDITRKTIGIRINNALANANKLQKDLAKELNVTDNTVSYFCSGKRTPNVEQIIIISKFLGISTDYLLGLSDVPTTDTDVKAVCEFTGLSDLSIEILQYLSDTDYIDVLNIIIESLDQTIKYSLDIELEKPESNLFSALKNYLMSDFTSNNELLNITLSGKVKDYRSTDRNYARDNLTHYKDLISIGEISSSKIVEQVLMNIIISELRKKKEDKNSLPSQSTDEDLPF